MKEALYLSWNKMNKIIPTNMYLESVMYDPAWHMGRRHRELYLGFNSTLKYCVLTKAASCSNLSWSWNEEAEK